MLTYLSTPATSTLIHLTQNNFNLTYLITLTYLISVTYFINLTYLITLPYLINLTYLIDLTCLIDLTYLIVKHEIESTLRILLIIIPVYADLLIYLSK